MSLPGIEVPLEKAFTQNIKEIGKGKALLKDNAKVPLYCACSVAYGQFWWKISIRSVQESSRTSVCMLGSRECCPVCVRIQELCVRVSLAVWYAAKYGMTSHNTSTGLEYI